MNAEINQLEGNIDYLNRLLRYHKLLIKGYSINFGCEQLDLIFQIIYREIHNIYSEGSEQDKQDFYGRPSHRITVDMKVDDGGGIYIPELNRCISGHFIRTYYVPNLVNGDVDLEDLHNQLGMSLRHWKIIMKALNQYDYVKEEIKRYSHKQEMMRQRLHEKLLEERDGEPLPPLLLDTREDKLNDLLSMIKEDPLFKETYNTVGKMLDIPYNLSSFDHVDPQQKRMHLDETLKKLYMEWDPLLDDTMRDELKEYVYGLS